MKLLEAIDISVRFSETIILNHVDFCVEKGQLIGLIGANGSGKTTLLRTLAGLLPGQQTSVFFMGEALTTTDRRQLARKLAYLPQGNESHWPVTVETLVMLGRLPHRKPWQAESDQDREVVRQALQACDAGQFAGRMVSTLSGGERARVMLARALAVEPKLLLADEPIAGLDPGHQLEVMDRLRKLTETGMAIVTVIHDLTLAARYCHHLVLLGEQSVIAQGLPEQVLSEDNLARCFNIRAEVGRIEGHLFVIPIERYQR